MAQYKVLQDIEAEDKLLGPLTLKQFIYAAITVTLGFIAFKLSTSLHSVYVIFLFLPEMLFFGLLAAPFGIDQPNEVWLLAKFRFYLKPQIRKWDQDGVGSLVTITAPKKVEKKLTKDFTATEAKSRLESLAKILDTGGWVAANTGATIFKTSVFSKDSDDRLMDLSSITSGQPTFDIVDQDDIFDESNLQVQHINSAMTDNERKVRDYQKNLMASPTPGISSDQVPISGSLRNFALPKNYVDSAPAEPAFGPIESRFNPRNTIQINPIPADTTQNDQSSVTTQTDNAKISVLARDNNLSIASIKRELKGGDDANEVVISLH